MGEQNLQTQRRAMGLVSSPAQGKGSPMAGPGWRRRRPSKTTSAISKTSRKKRMRTRTMTLLLITPFENKLKMTKMRTTDV